MKFSRDDCVKVINNGREEVEDGARGVVRAAEPNEVLVYFPTTGTLNWLKNEKLIPIPPFNKRATQ